MCRFYLNAGLNEKVAAYLDAERIRAYWAGVAGEPAESVLNEDLPQEWQEPDHGRVGVALGMAHLTLNGAYESLKQLVQGALGVLTRWPALQVWHVLLIYLMASGGGRLSQVKHFAWADVRGLLKDRRGFSASSFRNWIVAAAERAKEKVTVRRADGSEEQITRLQDYQVDVLTN